MSDLEARICRLVCVPVRDHAGQGADALVRARETHPWGGYIFFGGELEAVRSLLSALRGASQSPLLLAADLERGLGQQLPGGTSFPPAMALGAAGDPSLCRAVGLATAREARAVGLNCVFAPVVDLANEPANPIVCTRAFGDDPERVAELGSAFLAGLQEGGVLATAKHFPGHGRTRLDSHEGLPVVDAPAAEILGRDLLPFRRAVAAGVALVMSAHVAYPALERFAGAAAEGAAGTAPRPATLSRAILEGLLRGELGFRGAVVSDALMMGAVAEIEPGELAARALDAGVDCLLYPPDPPALVRALAVRVERGELAPEIVERAGERLERALSRLPAEDAGAAEALGPPLPGAAELARRVAAAGLVQLGELPSAAGPDGRELVLLLLDGGIDRAEVVLPSVAAAPGREFRWLVPAEEPARVPEDLGAFDRVHLACFSPIRAWKGRAGLSPAAGRLAGDLLAARPDAILLSFSSPFILRDLPAPRAAILGFGEAAACQFAVGEVLAGRSSPAGRLPVRL